MGVPGAEPPGRLRSFQKIVKKSMKNLQFAKKFSRKFRDFFKIFLKFARIYENLDKNLEICICRGFGGQSPLTQANLWKSE